MNWNKLKPWNWFKKEQSAEPGGLVPVSGGPLAPPPGSLAQFHDEIERAFDNVRRRFGLSFGTPGEPFSGSWLRPCLDISESPRAYTIRVEIPGVERDDVQLRLSGDTLVISGEKRQEKESEDGGYHCVERSYGSFRRMVSLPDDSDADKLEASFRNGVLTVTVPRREATASSARVIEIR